ncbi:hypothetical protein Trydic_g9835 [Trypoxylus dichotomus]
MQRSSISQRPIPELNPNDINIVLVGETGVGKSTFINAFVNYLKFASLDDALSAPDIYCLIASKFTITDDNFEEHDICTGEDENECTEAGASSTQSSRSYRFTIGELTVRLIDTPGIGDTRGISKDEENFDRLLGVLGELKYIHSFCILLKPNGAKLTVLFQYCIKQLLSRLDKSACQNIVFVFTNSRSTFYKLGDTGGPLKGILNNIKNTSNAEIPFNKKNSFFMDNEAFRFLLAQRNGITFTDNEKKDFSISWEKSADISLQLLTYVASLQPHKIQDTISINEARRLILTLSEPLAHVAKNIDDNLRCIIRKQEELQDENKTVEELKKLLHYEMIRIKVVDIGHPRTVCTHQDCTDVHIIEDSKHINYKQVCHPKCYLKQVPKKVVGSPELKNCEAMEGLFNRTCKHCKHSYGLHMHISFTTEPYMSREINMKVNADIKKKEEFVRQIEDAINDLKNQKLTLETEKRTVQQSMAKFAHFLNNNAIVPYNDKYQEYIQYLIESENAQSVHRRVDLIASYQNLISAHKQQVNILDEELKKAQQENSDAIIVSTEEVMRTVEQLLRLHEQRLKEIANCNQEDSSVALVAKLNQSKVVQDGSKERKFEKIEKKKKLFKCYSCGKVEHFKKGCLKNKVGQPKIDKQFGQVFISMQEAGNSKDCWLIDSGASHHVCCKADWFFSCTKFSEPRALKLGDGRIMCEGHMRVKDK